MPSERGQASVEWVGAVLLLAVTLGALARVAERADGTEIATAGLRATTCALHRDCEGAGDKGAPTAGGGLAATDGGGLAATDGRPARAVTLPPLVPPPALGGSDAGAGSPRPRPRAAPRRPSPLSGRARARAGTLWRRAWLACFAYERVRYGLLHPESAPRQTVPLRGALQMVNDCVSPVDFARDWELLTGR
jgi:hypothetical protein